MKSKLSKMPPLRGTPEQQLEQIRTHFNKAIDEITRALEELERENERLRKERK